MAQLAGVQEQLRQLTAKWDNSVVASVNRLDEPNRSWTLPRGQSPRRVDLRFSEDQQYSCRRSDSPNCSLSGFPSRDRYPSPYRGDRGTRYGAFGGFGGQSVQYGNQPFNLQSAYNMSPSNFYGGQPNQMPTMTQMRGQCPKCGGQRHESFNSCPAVNRNCRFCSKKGHFVRVCRAAARAGMQQH